MEFSKSGNTVDNLFQLREDPAQPGSYTISAQSQGFQTLTFTNVELTQSAQVRQNFTLIPATQATSVEVTAEADTVLSTTTASVGSVLA